MEQKQTERIISRKEFSELTGLCRTTVWRLLSSGNAPIAIKINGRVIGFRESDYLAWLENNSTL